MRKHHNKLYYGQYRYKSVFKMPGSLMFYPTTDQYLHGLKKKHPGLNDLNSLADFIIKNRKKIKFRIQDKKSIFYTNMDHAQELISRFWKYWYDFTMVDPKFVKNRKDIVICDRLPHGKYQYQIHLKKDAQHHITKEEKAALWNFIKNNNDNCLITSGPVETFLSDAIDWLYGGYYFYVKKESTISALYILANNIIDKVIKYEKVKKNGSN